MKALLTLLLLLPSLLFSQEDEAEFLSDFFLEENVKADNSLNEFSQYDFSSIWTLTDENYVYGILGEEYQRIRIKILDVKKDLQNPRIYQVQGKSMVKENICDLKGTIELEEIRETENFHYGIDNEYIEEGFKIGGMLKASYEFNEHSCKKGKGVFTGTLYSKWLLDPDDNILYDDIDSVADGYMNNAFIGVWTSSKTDKNKICRWGDYRVPLSKQGFDIGAGQFSVSEEYGDKGWLDVISRVYSQANSNDETYSGYKAKEWWE